MTLTPERISELKELAGKALSLLKAEDERQDKIHDLLETIRDQIRFEIAPEHRPDGLMTNIQNAVYAMRGRTRLMNDVALTTPLDPATLLALLEEIGSMREALEWYAEQSRLCRLIHSEGDAGRHALSADGGKRARKILDGATP